jgi:hypothetical protein
MRLATIAIGFVVATLASAGWIRAASPGSDAESPVEVKQSHRLARGHWMETRAVFSRTGRIDVHTRTWSKSEVSGFHGAVVVFLLDKHRNRLYSTEPQSYGVNSKMLPGDERTDSFHEVVPAEIIAKTDAIVIQHLYQPQSEFLDRLHDATVAGGYLTSILAEGAKVLLLP